MPDVARIIWDGQAGGENSRDIPFDLDARTGQVAKLVNLIPGQNSIPRWGCPLVNTTDEADEIDWVFPFRSTEGPTIFVAKSGMDLIQIAMNGKTSILRQGAFPDQGAMVDAVRIGNTIIIGNSYADGKAWAVKRVGNTLTARPANISRPNATVLSAENYTKTQADGKTIDTTDSEYGSWWMPQRTSRAFSTTWVRREDDAGNGPSGLPITTETWGAAVAESWENLEDRLIFTGTDSDLIGETKLTINVSPIPDGATHLRLWTTIGYQWPDKTGPGNSEVEAAGANLRWWKDVSIYDLIESPSGYKTTQALHLTEGWLGGQTVIVDSTGGNEIPPCSKLKYHNGLLWAGGGDLGDVSGTWYYSLGVTGAEPLRTLTLFNLSDRNIPTSPDGTDRSVGVGASHGSLYFIGERDVYVLPNGDPVNYNASRIAQDMGTTFPNTIVERGQEIYYLSQQGPAVISDGVVELLDSFDVAAIWPNPNGEDTYFFKLSPEDRLKVRSWWCRGYWFISDGKKTVALRTDRGQLVGGMTIEFPASANLVPKLVAHLDEDECYVFGGKQFFQWTKDGVYTDGRGAYFTASATYRRARMDQRRKQKVGEAYDILVHAHWLDAGQLRITVTAQGGRGHYLYQYDQRPITDPLQNTDVADAWRDTVQQGVREMDNLIGSWFQVQVEKVIRGPFTLTGAELGVILRKGQEFEYVSMSAGQTPPTPPPIDFGMAIFDYDRNRGENG